MRSSLWILVLVMAAGISSCRDKALHSEIPYAYVDVQLNLNDITYLDLQHDQGYVYIPGGVHGIIVYRVNGQLYRAFERNCPFQSSDPAAIIEVHSSGFYMEDPTCKSTFDFKGDPTGGPAQLPMKQYYTYLQGNILYISSE